MLYTKEEAEQAIQFAKELKITAELDPEDGETLRFITTPEIPDSFHDDIKLTFDICLEHHQRSVFTGEYLTNDANPPATHPGNPLGEINFFLDHYKHYFISEIKKGVDLEETLHSDDRPKRKITPFAKVMMQHRAKRLKNK